MRKTISIALLVFLIPALRLSAQDAAAASLIGRKHVLSNGLTVILQRDASSATTVLQVIIPGGRAAEPSGKEGLAYLTTRLALEIPNENEAQDLVSFASTFSVFSEGDYSAIRVKCLTSRLAKTLDILCGVLRKPLFSGIRIDRIRESMIHSGLREQDEPSRLGHWQALAAFFGPGGYGAYPLGREDTLKAIKVRDILDFYKSHFTSDGMIIAASSNLQEKELLSVLEKNFAGLRRGEPQAVPAISARVPESRSIEIGKEAKQSFISRCFALPAVSARGYVLGFILGYLLGPHPGSRLWPIRSEEMLAYYINSRIEVMKNGGMLEVYLETDRAKTDSARQALRAVLDKLYEDGAGDVEFSRLRAGTRAEFLRLKETKSARSESLAEFETLGLGHGFFTEFLTVLDSLALRDLNDFIKAVLKPDSSVEVVIGPGAEAAAH